MAGVSGSPTGWPDASDEAATAGPTVVEAGSTSEGVGAEGDEDEGDGVGGDGGAAVLRDGRMPGSRRCRAPAPSSRIFARVLGST